MRSQGCLAPLHAHLPHPASSTLSTALSGQKGSQRVCMQQQTLGFLCSYMRSDMAADSGSDGFREKPGWSSRRRLTTSSAMGLNSGPKRAVEKERRQEKARAKASIIFCKHSDN